MGLGCWTGTSCGRVPKLLIDPEVFVGVALVLMKSSLLADGCGSERTGLTAREASAARMPTLSGPRYGSEGGAARACARRKPCGHDNPHPSARQGTCALSLATGNSPAGSARGKPVAAASAPRAPWTNAFR